MGQSVFLVRVLFSCLSSAQQWEHWVFGFFFFGFIFLFCFVLCFFPARAGVPFPLGLPAAGLPSLGSGHSFFKPRIFAFGCVILAALSDFCFIISNRLWCQKHLCTEKNLHQAPCLLPLLLCTVPAVPSRAAGLQWREGLQLPPISQGPEAGEGAVLLVV